MNRLDQMRRHQPDMTVQEWRRHMTRLETLARDGTGRGRALAVLQGRSAAEQDFVAQTRSGSARATGGAAGHTQTMAQAHQAHTGYSLQPDGEALQNSIRWLEQNHPDIATRHAQAIDTAQGPEVNPADPAGIRQVLDDARGLHTLETDLIRAEAEGTDGGGRDNGGPNPEDRKSKSLLEDEGTEQSRPIQADVNMMNDITMSGARIRKQSHITAIGDDERTIINFEESKDQGHGHTVLVHGMLEYDEKGGLPKVDGNPTSIEQIADAVRSNPAYRSGDKVQLASCWSASSGVAQQLANQLGTSVYAPTRRVSWFWYWDKSGNFHEGWYMDQELLKITTEIDTTYLYPKLPELAKQHPKITPEWKLFKPEDE